MKSNTITKTLTLYNVFRIDIFRTKNRISDTVFQDAKNSSFALVKQKGSWLRQPRPFLRQKTVVSYFVVVERRG